MAKRMLDKMALHLNEDWYGNNAAITCSVCGKVFIVSGFLNKGFRDCPICHKTSAKMINDTVTIEWPDKQEIWPSSKIAEKSGKRPLGLFKGEIWISQDFSEPMELIESSELQALRLEATQATKKATKKGKSAVKRSSKR
jgi:hypothetical protein